MPASPIIARVQWPGQNSIRSYPLAHFATGTSVDTHLKIPSATFVDAKISIYWETQLNFAGFFIRELTFTSTHFRAVIHHLNVSEPVGICVGTLSDVENISHAIVGQGVLNGTRGVLVTGDLSYLKELTPGRYLFDHAATAFDPGVVYAQPKAVRSIRVESDGASTRELTGNIVFRPSASTQFRVLQDTNENGVEQTIIIWDATGGDALQDDCPCENSDLRPVLTVAGLPPNESGAIDIFGSRCLEVTAQGAGVQLQNSCSEPCCDCAEDSGLDSRIDMLYSQISAMENRLSVLENAYALSSQLIQDDATLSCDTVRCQPYDSEVQGLLIDPFKLSDFR